MPKERKVKIKTYAGGNREKELERHRKKVTREALGASQR